VVHLNKHGFERLMWFKDLNLLIRARISEIDGPWLSATARSEGVWDSVRYGVSLLKQLFDTPNSPEGNDMLGLHKPSCVWLRLWNADHIL
jgi:hypothetical protein